MCSLHTIIIPRVMDSVVCGDYKRKDSNGKSSSIENMETGYLYQCFTDVNYEPRKLILLREIHGQLVSASIFENKSTPIILIPESVIDCFQDKDQDISVDIDGNILNGKFNRGSLSLCSKGKEVNKKRKYNYISFGEQEIIRDWIEEFKEKLDGVELYTSNEKLFKKLGYPILLDIVTGNNYNVRHDVCALEYLVWCAKKYSE